MEMLRAASNAWLELVNPLMGLSVRRAQAVFDFARAYGSPQLQYIYNEIEASDPVLLTCVERRAAAIAAMGWKFTVRAEADAALAEEQRAALKTFAGNIENLTEALEHLDLAFFRGYSHVQPIWEADGTVRRIQLLKSWNFLHDRLGETWYWNPEAHATPAGLEVITPDARLVTVTRRRAIDYPALTIYIRHALGERDWGRFVEHYGIPPADITMPPNATEKDKPQFEAAADAAQNAQNVVLPNGSTVSRAAETRGQNPFLDFCNYQAKQILILATGGTLATLAEGDTGTLAGNAQENVWKQIVARDGSIISDAVNRALFRPFLRQAFPGRPVAVDFELGDEKTLTASEVFDLAGKAKTAGWRIAQDELEEASGFTLERDESAPQGGVFGFAREPRGAMPFKRSLHAFKNAPRVSGGQRGVFSAARSYGPSRADSGDAQKLLEAVARDTAPAADLVKRFMALIESGATDDAIREQAAAIMRELPELLPEDPALAAVIRDAITEAYVSAALDALSEAGSIAAAKDTECRAQDPAHCPTHGTPEYKAATTEDVKKFKEELPDDISPEDFDTLLTTGFDDVDGAGNTVKYGTLLRDHVNKRSRNEEDRNARKKRLGVAVKMVRQSNPIATSRNGGKERIYAGIINGKAYVAVADEHNEIGTIEMVSYRRDGKHDE